jgi:L-serine deaminase
VACVSNIISAAEVIKVMYRIEKEMPRKLREAGLAKITVKSKKEKPLK